MGIAMLKAHIRDVKSSRPTRLMASRPKFSASASSLASRNTGLLLAKVVLVA